MEWLDRTVLCKRRDGSQEHKMCTLEYHLQKSDAANVISITQQGGCAQARSLQNASRDTCAHDERTHLKREASACVSSSTANIAGQ